MFDHYLYFSLGLEVFSVRKRRAALLEDPLPQHHRAHTQSHSKQPGQQGSVQELLALADRRRRQVLRELARRTRANLQFQAQRSSRDQRHVRSEGWSRFRWIGADFGSEDLYVLGRSLQIQGEGERVL